MSCAGLLHFRRAGAFALVALATIVASGVQAAPPARETADFLPEVMTAATVQSAEGVPTLTLEFVAVMGKYLAGRVDARSKEYLAATGHPELELPKAESAATLMKRNGEHVGVVRIHQGEYAQAVFIVVIRDDKLLRVVCSRESSEPVPVTFGPCAEKIKETFGYSL